MVPLRGQSELDVEALISGLVLQKTASATSTGDNVRRAKEYSDTRNEKQYGFMVPKNNEHLCTNSYGVLAFVFDCQ